MSVVNIPLQTDDFAIYGGDIQILQNAATYTINTNDLVCSMNLQKGGSVKVIIDELARQNNFSNIVCIEPYGDILFDMTKYGANVCLDSFGLSWDQSFGDSTSMTEIIKVNFNLTNQLKHEVVPVIHYYAYKNGMDFKYYDINDNEYYTMFANGVIYFENGAKTEKNTYKLVYVDRDATTECAIKAVQFFKDKIVTNGLIVFDDYTLYDFSSVNQLLIENNFTIVEAGDWKVIYKKT